MNKRGQVTIFVIVAIVLVAIFLILFLYRGGPNLFQAAEVSPTGYLKDCIEPEIKATVDVLSKNGGYLNPDGTVMYNGEEIKYLCYASDFYDTCVVQQPMIKSHFEKELNSIIQPKAEQCVRSLKQEYERRGYSVSALSVDSLVEIVPGKIKVNFVAPMTVTKESSQTFREFDVQMNSEIYDLLFIASSIVDFEAAFGDSETTLYIQYYPNIKIEKILLSDGTTIYKLSNVVTKEEFVFASRSVAWPPGYGL